MEDVQEEGEQLSVSRRSNLYQTCGQRPDSDMSGSMSTETAMQVTWCPHDSFTCTNINTHNNASRWNYTSPCCQCYCWLPSCPCQTFSWPWPWMGPRQVGPQALQQSSAQQRFPCHSSGYIQRRCRDTLVYGCESSGLNISVCLYFTTYTDVLVTGTW